MVSYIFTWLRIFNVFTSTFFLFLSKKIDENSFFQNQITPICDFTFYYQTNKQTHKVNIHLQPNFRRLIFEISYEIYLSVCKIIKGSEGPNRKSHLGGQKNRKT